MAGLVVSGVRKLSEARLQELARDLEAIWRHRGSSGPEGLGARERALYDELVRVWATRGVQLRLF